jgi:hypothetical protein
MRGRRTGGRRSPAADRGASGWPRRSAAQRGNGGPRSRDRLRAAAWPRCASCVSQLIVVWSMSCRILVMASPIPSSPQGAMVRLRSDVPSLSSLPSRCCRLSSHSREPLFEPGHARLERGEAGRGILDIPHPFSSLMSLKTNHLLESRRVPSGEFKIHRARQPATAAAFGNRRYFGDNLLCTRSGYQCFAGNPLEPIDNFCSTRMLAICADRREVAKAGRVRGSRCSGNFWSCRPLSP